MTDRRSGAESDTPWRDLRVRILTAAILIPLVIAAVRLGGWWFSGLVALAAALMAHEWTRLVHSGNAVQFLMHAAAGVGAALLAPFLSPGVVAWLIVALWAGSLGATYFRRHVLTLWAFAGVPYVAAPATALVVLRSDAAWGFAAVLWLLVVVWIADTAAYFIGRIIGGPKLAPAISPKKTWAGLLGAIVGGGLAGLAVAASFGTPRLWPLLLIGSLLGAIEQAGDLFESAMKRWAHVKDSGLLVPGHGGILDRVDGLIAAAVAATIIGMANGKGAPAASGLLLW
jgi:phosphatidate cytidylyltransferase